MMKTTYFLSGLLWLSSSSMTQARVGVDKDATEIKVGGKTRGLENMENVALASAGATATQSSTAHNGWPARAIDGNESGHWGHGSVSHTGVELNPWWQVDLGKRFEISMISIYNREDCCSERLHNAIVEVIDYTGDVVYEYTLPDIDSEYHEELPAGLIAKYVKVSNSLPSGEKTWLNIAEVKVFSDNVIYSQHPSVSPAPSSAPTIPLLNVALNKPAEQSSTDHSGVAARAVDGGTRYHWGSGSVTHTKKETDPYWRVDLMNRYDVEQISIYNRNDDCCRDRILNALVEVFDYDGQVTFSTTLASVENEYHFEFKPGTLYAMRVKVSLPGSGRILSLAEVEVHARVEVPYTIPAIMGPPYFPLDISGCTFDAVFSKIDEMYYYNATAALLTEFNAHLAAVATQFESACSAGWDKVEVSEWTAIDPKLTEKVVTHYFDGGTALNYEIGNLDREDQSATYPNTNEWVLEIADSVELFHDEGDGPIEDAPLATVPSLDNCALPSIMCCFGSDRQSGDNNGNCAATNCGNASPGDNTNVCFKDNNEEGAVHCHGLAMSENENDFSHRLRMNNLFFISMFDHWYTRGYVENSMDSEKHFTGIPMCGCMEDMPAVTRADCSEVVAEKYFIISYSAGGGLVVEPDNTKDMSITFNACSGPRYLNPDSNKNNDLSTYINRLVREGKMSVTTQMQIFEKLVGYENPDDNGNEAACDEYMTSGVRTTETIYGPGETFVQ